MRKIIYSVFTALGLCLLAGCSSSSNDNSSDEDSPYYTQITGDWRLSVWNGETPADFDVYVTFNADRSFMIYQKVDKPTWEKLAGSYRFDDQTISGIYGDGTPWGSSYQVKLDLTNKTLTMTSNVGGEVNVYVRATIPSTIKGAAASVQSTRSAKFLLF